MNKFIVVLADRNEPDLHDWFESCAVVLQKTFPKVLGIQPHILLFESEKEISDALAALPKSPHQDAQVLLFQACAFRGSAGIDRMSDLIHFFH